MYDRLLLEFVTDFRAAQNNGNVGTHSFDSGYHFGRWRDVPDIDPETDDFGIPGKQDFRNVDGALIDIELGEASAGLERAEIGQQVTQSER